MLYPKLSLPLRAPDRKDISTSYVERTNLGMRMAIRRFTRLTNAHSKKLEMHKHSVAIHFTYTTSAGFTKRSA